MHNSSFEKVTSLCAAAEHGHTQIVKCLLAVKGIDVNKGGRYGWNPLHKACIKGYLEIAKVKPKFCSTSQIKESV